MVIIGTWYAKTAVQMSGIIPCLRQNTRSAVLRDGHHPFRAIHVSRSLSHFLILAVSLLASPTPSGAAPQPSQPASLHLRALVSANRAVHLVLDPATRGSNHVVVWLTNSQNQVLTTVSMVELRWAMLEQATVLPTAEPIRQADGYWSLPQVPLDSPGWWEVDLTFQLPDQAPVDTRFFLLIPDPTLIGPPPAHSTNPQAEAVFQAALERIKQLSSMRAEEKLTDGLGDTLDTHYAYLAPDKFAYTTSAGFSSVIIGDAQYSRDPGGAWRREQRPRPYAFPADFPTYYTKATEQTLGVQQELDGERCQLITFRIPASGLWYAWWVGTQTHLLRREAMVASHHYMVSHFTDFDRPIQITAPS